MSMCFQPGEGSSRDLLRECKTSRNLREGSFEALVTLRHTRHMSHAAGRFGSCEQFWSLYSHLVKPGDLASHSDFHLFKMGIKPMWEDEANKFGGKWIVRLRKGAIKSTKSTETNN